MGLFLQCSPGPSTPGSVSGGFCPRHISSSRHAPFHTSHKTGRNSPKKGNCTKKINKVSFLSFFCDVINLWTLEHKETKEKCPRKSRKGSEGSGITCRLFSDLS